MRKNKTNSLYEQTKTERETKMVFSRGRLHNKSIVVKMKHKLAIGLYCSKPHQHTHTLLSNLYLAWIVSSFVCHCPSFVCTILVFRLQGILVMNTVLLNFTLISTSCLINIKLFVTAGTPKLDCTFELLMYGTCCAQSLSYTAQTMR